MTKLGRRTMFRRSASDGGMPGQKACPRIAARARRWRAVRISLASSDCESAALADRLGYELPRRSRARLSPDAPGKGGVCREPHGSRHAICVSHQVMGTKQFEDALAAVQRVRCRTSRLNG